VRRAYRSTAPTDRPCEGRVWGSHPGRELEAAGGRKKGMEGPELAARLSQCGRTQFRHHSRPRCLGEDFGSSPSLAGFGGAGDGWCALRAPALQRDGVFGQSTHMGRGSG